MKPRAILTGGLAALAAGVGAALALAGTGDLEYEATTTSLPDNTQNTLTVECDSAPVIGGGGTVVGNVQYGTEMSSSAPFDDGDGDKRPDDGWLVSGNNDNSGEQKGITIWGVCTPRGELTYRSDRVSLPGRRRPTAHKVACPSGASVTGGGANVKLLSSGVEMAVSAPYDDGDQGNVPSDGWRVVLTNFLGLDTNMRVFAICAAQGNYSYHLGQTLVLPESENSVSKLCPDGKAAVGGGGSVSKPRWYTHLSGSEPWDDEPIDPIEGWQASAGNDSADENRLVSSWAICRG